MSFFSKLIRAKYIFSDIASLEQWNSSKQAMSFAVISLPFPKFGIRITLPLILFRVMEVLISKGCKNDLNQKSYGLQNSVYLKLKESPGL